MSGVYISKDHQVVIPHSAIKVFDLHPGDKMEIFEFDGRIVLVPVKPMKELRAFITGVKNTFQRENDRLIQ